MQCAGEFGGIDIWSANQFILWCFRFDWSACMTENMKFSGLLDMLTGSVPFTSPGPLTVR